MSFFEVIDEDIIQLLEFSKTVSTLEDHSRRNRPLYKKLKELTPFLPEKARAKQRLWYIEHNTKDDHRCIKCNVNPTSWVLINNSYNRFCSNKCAHNHSSVSEKTKQTNVTKYGVEWNLTSETSKRKKDATCLEKYGTVDPTQLDEIKDKRKNTMIDRHGVEHNWANGPLRELQKQTMVEMYGVEYPIQNEDIKEKTKTTNWERYGVEWNVASESSKQKKDDTCLEKFGVNNPFGNKDIQTKIKQTMLSKYGVEYATQSVKILEQIKQTNLEKYGVEWNIISKSSKSKQKETMIAGYGVEYPLQSVDIQEKIKQNNILKYGVEYHAQQHMIDILPLIESKEWMIEQYINQNKTATQIAGELNISNVTVCCYLHNHNIEIRQVELSSYKCNSWLESIMKSENIHIQYAGNGREYHIPGMGTSRADGYCVETKTIYEFHGDYWHGNPSVFESMMYNKSTKSTMGELYQATIKRENKIKDLGYNLVVMWECNWNI